MNSIVYHDYLSHIKYTYRTFGKTDTIYGAILYHNYNDLTPAEYDELMSRFNEMNNWILPKVGSQYKVPVLIRHTEK